MSQWVMENSRFVESERVRVRDFSLLRLWPLPGSEVNLYKINQSVTLTHSSLLAHPTTVSSFKTSETSAFFIDKGKAHQQEKHYSHLF